jgi:hypothetical protein
MRAIHVHGGIMFTKGLTVQYASSKGRAMLELLEE